MKIETTYWHNDSSIHTDEDWNPGIITINGVDIDTTDDSEG